MPKKKSNCNLYRHGCINSDCCRRNDASSKLVAKLENVHLSLPLTLKSEARRFKSIAL